MVKAKGSSKELSIGNLLTLIRWAGGQVIADPPLPLLRLSTHLVSNPYPIPNIQEHAGDYLTNTCITCCPGTLVHQEEDKADIVEVWETLEVPIERLKA